MNLEDIYELHPELTCPACKAVGLAVFRNPEGEILTIHCSQHHAFNVVPTPGVSFPSALLRKEAPPKVMIKGAEPTAEEYAEILSTSVHEDGWFHFKELGKEP